MILNLILLIFIGIEDPPTQRGIIPRAFQHIFESIQVAENTKFLVHASYLEIYNEEIRDLLVKYPYILCCYLYVHFFSTAIKLTF